MTFGRSKLYRLISIDPGVTHTAFASWDNANRLTGASIVKNSDMLREDMAMSLCGYRATYCAVESQFKVEGGAVRTSDLIALAYWAGRAAEAANAFTKTLVTVADWKRNAPKRVSCPTTWGRLGTLEQRRVEPVLVRTLLKNRCRVKTVPAMLDAMRADNFGSTGIKQCSDILDACGIGLWALNRTERVGLRAVPPVEETP